MADETLQAFQLGANLYDRAQTQSRLMAEMKRSAARSIIDTRGAELQNKIRELELGRALKNQEDDLADVDNMNYNVQSVDTFFINPDSPFPAFKPVKSAKNQAILNQYRQQLDDYSERSKLIKGLAASRSALVGQLGTANDYAKQNNDYQALWDNNNGLDQYGNPDPEKIKKIYSSYGPKIEQVRLAGETIKNVGQDVAAELMKLPPDQRYLPESIKSAQDAAEARRADRLLPSERLKTDIATGAVADWQELFGTPDARTASTIKGNVLQSDWKYPSGDDGKVISGDYSTAQKSAKLIDELNKFEKTYGKNKIQNYVGIIDGNLEELLRRAKTAKTEEERNAYSLLQRFQKTFNDEAFATSGKAVTQSEGTRLKAAIGDIKSNNFVNDVNNFATFAGEDLYNTVDQFKTRYKITREQVKLANELVGKYSLSFTPFGQQQQSAPAPSTGTAPSLPPGVTPRTNATNSTSGVIFTP